jgi:hypothetical protein
MIAGMPDIRACKGDLNPAKAHKSLEYAGEAHFQ